MSNTTGINNTINTNIAPNGVGRITAAILASTLTAMTLWVSTLFAGVSASIGIGVAGDPTGATDSSSAINVALTTVTNGQLSNVILPNGTFLINNPLAVGSTTGSQCLIGQGWGTQLIVGPTFNPNALGVIIPSTNPNAFAQPCVKNVRITFQQPNDLTSPAIGTNASGQATIHVTSTTGLSVGMYVNDQTNLNAIPNPPNLQGVTLSTIASINSGASTVTLNVNLAATIPGGDIINFAPPRASFTTLSQGCSTTAGAPFCKYPWAIYGANSTNDLTLDNVLIEAAWQGVYIRGSTFHIGSLKVGALLTGLDIDSCFNFPKIIDYMFWDFGLNANYTYVQQAALIEAFYDGNPVAANLGRVDGLAVDSLQTWTGIVNLTSTWSFGSFSQIMLDGANANLSITSATSFGFALIQNLYSTKPAQTYGSPIYLNNTGTFFTKFGNFVVISASPYNSGIVNANGLTTIEGGYIDDIQQANIPMIQVQGGQVQLENLTLDASAGRTDTYLNQTGGSLQIGPNVNFRAAPGAAGVGFATSANNALNSIASTTKLNGWQVSGFTPIGSGSCPIKTQTGFNDWGVFVANGACAAGTVILTFVAPATNSRWCKANDITTPADVLNQTSIGSGTTVTFTGTMANGDIITFNCQPA